MDRQQILDLIETEDDVRAHVVQILALLGPVPGQEHTSHVRADAAIPKIVACMISALALLSEATETANTQAYVSVFTHVLNSLSMRNVHMASKIVNKIWGDSASNQQRGH